MESAKAFFAGVARGVPQAFGASVFLLRLSFMREFRASERERLLPTGDRERLSCSLENSVFLENLFSLLVLWPLGIGLSDLKRLFVRSCFVGLLFLSPARLRWYDFR